MSSRIKHLKLRKRFGFKTTCTRPCLHMVYDATGNEAKKCGIGKVRGQGLTVHKPCEGKEAQSTTKSKEATPLARKDIS
jgi:hypothetical protein